MLLEGEDERTTRGLLATFSWSAPALYLLSTEAAVFSAVTDVLRWQGLEAVVVLRDFAPLVTVDLQPRPGHWRDVPGTPSVQSGSWVGAAIRVESQAVGVLLVHAGQLTPSACQVVDQFAQLAAAAVSRLRQLRGQEAALEASRSLQRRVMAEERLSVLGEAATVLAHEIRNPLASIVNALTLVERQAIDQAAGLAIIREEAMRLEALTRDLLQMARPLEPKRQRVDLEGLALRAMERVRSDTRESGVRIELVRSGALLEASADPGLLGLALENLLRNAVQASSRGARVQVIVSRTPEEVSMAVEDEGPGIPLEDRSRIFEPFFTTRAVGTGLGLPIVQRLVQAHGGVVRVGSGAVGGARFEMVLSAL